MHMAGLGHAFARVRAVGQAVTLDHGDAGEQVGERPRRQESGHAAADDDRMVPMRGVHGRVPV